MKRILFSIFILTIAVVIGLPAFINLLSPAKIEQSGTVVHLYSHAGGKVINLPVEDYVLGVVAAEMPAEFPEEALKAQAVAARTYIMKRLGAGGVANPLHPGADVCDDHRHYQAWIDSDEMKKRWGTLKYYKYYLKIAMAVHATKGEILTYNGQIIDPVYHSSCGGMGTVDSGEVWKFDAPYLKGVPCPDDADPQPVREVVFSAADFRRAVGVDINYLPATAGKVKLIDVIEETAGGWPKTIRMGDKLLSAVAVREMLGLRSARFNIAVEDGRVKVSTVGYGHGVGMCQYGAGGMAQKGKTYRDILKHYYTGVEINKIK